MATHDTRGLAPSQNPTEGTVWTARGRVNFKVLANKLGRVVPANDGAAIIDLPAGTTLLGGHIASPIVEGGTLTVDIGITNGGTEIQAGWNANNNTTPTKFGTKPLFEGDADYPLNSATTIYMQANNAADKAVVDVVLYCLTHTNVMIKPD